MLQHNLSIKGDHTMEFRDPTALPASRARNYVREEARVEKVVIQSRVRKLAIAVLFGGVGLAMAASLPASVVALPVCAFAAVSVYCFYRALGGPAYVSLSPKRRCHVLSAPLCYFRRPVRRVYRSGVETLRRTPPRGNSRQQPERRFFSRPREFARGPEREPRERMRNPVNRKVPHRGGLATVFD